MKIKKGARSLDLNSVLSARTMMEREGPESLRSEFGKLKEMNPGAAARLMNARDLPFPVFFALLPRIKSEGLAGELGIRGRAAASLCARVVKDEEAAAVFAGSTAGNRNQQYPTLKWMFETGLPYDGTDGRLDAVLDAAAAILITRYHDAAVPAQVVRLIFGRNRRGAYIHDLVWCLYSAEDMNALRTAAQYLRSDRGEDRELARQILHIGSEDENEAAGGGEKAYRDYISWLRSNESFLYFTGESLQYSNAPAPCRVDFGAKYLCRRASDNSAVPAAAFGADGGRLNRFGELPEEDQEKLAEYSHALFLRNRMAWQRWIALPVDEQLKTAEEAGR